MASSGHLTELFIDGVRLSTGSFSLDLSIDTPQEDATTFQAAAASTVSMLNAATLEQNGYLTPSSSPRSLEAKLYAAVSASGVVAALFGTADAVCPAYVLPDADGSNVKIGAGQKLMTIGGKWGSGNLGIRRGKRIYQNSFTTTGPLPGADMGSAGSNGGTLYLFLYANTGSPTNAQIKIQSDSASNFATAVDHATITGISDLKAFSATLTGVIGRYVRLNVLSMGGSSSLTAMAILCLNGVTM